MRKGIGVKAAVMAVVAIGWCVAAGSPGAMASGGSFTWSGPRLVNATSGQSLERLACPGATQCVAVDQDGRLVVFDPGAPAPSTPTMLIPGVSPSGLACPTTTQCTVLDPAGHELTFNPGAPGSPTAVTIDAVTSSDTGIGGLACPSTTECVTSDGAGKAVVFNPQTPGTPTQISLGGTFGEIACPSTTQCTAINDTQAVTFDPTSTAAPTPATVEPNGLMFRIACPLVTQCTAVDQNGSEVTFNPQAPAPQTPVKLDNEVYNPLFSLACAAATQCTAGSGGGRIVTFNPQAPGTPTAVKIDPFSGGDVANQTGGVLGLACSSTGSCTLVDGAGQAVTFNPAAPGASEPVRIDVGAPVFGLSCPVASQCTTVDSGHEFTFDPVGHRPVTAKPIHSRGLGFYGIDCATAKQCTAVAPIDELTFNPRKFKSHKATAIDPDSDIGIVAVDCLSRTFCVVDDGNGGAVTFNQSTGRRIRKLIKVEYGESQTAMACPSKTECVSVDNDGTFITFNPVTGKRVAEARIDKPVGLDAPSGDSNDELDGVACPTARLCIAIDTLGNAVRFNPRTRGTGSLKAVDAGHQLHDIACPSKGTCVAVDSVGQALVGDPATNTWTAQSIPGASSLSAVSCPTTKECVAVDASGRAFTGKRP